MFRDLRGFRAIAFRSPSLERLSDLESLFPADAVEITNSPIEANSSGIDVLHCYYLADQEFSTRPIMEDYQVQRGNKTLYKHNMYFVSLPIGDTPTYIIAVPFLQMAKTVYPFIRDGARGRGVHYKMFRLPELVDAIRQDDNLEGALKITGVKFKIDGDELLDSLIFKGKEVPHSSTFKEAVDSIPDDGPKLTPEQVRLVHHTKENHLAIQLDQPGHFRFWLGRNASNMPGLLPIFAYLLRRKLLIDNASFPFMRELRTEGEDTEDG